MFAAAAAQLRLAASLGFGWRFSRWALEGVIEGLLLTRREFGTVGADAAEILGGPVLDEETRHELQLRRFRTQATRALETRYYREVFDDLDLETGRLSFADIARIPPTSQAAIRGDPGAFMRQDAVPCFRTTTTGTTGRPTGVCFSAYEMQTYIALGAITHLLTGHIDDGDIVQINTSSRAALGNTCFAGACERIGALVFLAGLIDPEQSLALLVEEHHIPGKKSRVSYLNTYPSYLGELVEMGMQMGYRPTDFGLERIIVGGELVSAGLQRRARDLFGPVEFDESYGMTETWPMTGQRCSEGHLHFEPGQGLVEVVDPQTGASALPGQAGTIVATPFPPYRDTTFLLRYDTQDVARPLEGSLSCNLRTLPGTSGLLGKLRFAIRHDVGWTFPRDVLEALEGPDDIPLPARYGMWAVPDGVAIEVVARNRGAHVRAAIERQLVDSGVPVQELRLVEHQSQLQRPGRLRCDLKEAAFPLPWPGNGIIPVRTGSAVLQGG
jgi:phenylacetate-CoA ligase